MDNKIHPFERTLGPGPYRYGGFFVIHKPSESCPQGNYHMLPQDVSGGTCSHCGQGIMNNFIIIRGDGKKFAVGSDCIDKVGMSADQMKRFKSEELRVEREKRQVKKEAKKAKQKEHLETVLRPRLKELASKDLTGFPHPSIPSLTFADYVKFVLERGGCKAVSATVKLVEQKLGME